MLTDEFRKAKSPSIVYEGKTVLLYDQLDVPKRGQITLVFLNAESEWPQGVWIGDMPAIRDLRLTVEGQRAPSMRIWQADAPEEVKVEFHAPQQSISLYNIWDPGNGQAISQLMGAGMWLEVLPDGKRMYRCNDGHRETSFSHLEFSLEVKELSQAPAGGSPEQVQL